jgi:ribonuclease HI
MKIHIFFFFFCSGNPGPGGCGTIIKYEDGSEKIISGGEKQTTNNRMELIAVIEGLKKIGLDNENNYETCEIDIVTDSKYVKDGITVWIHNWLKNNWTGAMKKPVKNQDLWKELYALTLDKKISWFWVKGHDGHPENERCDELARKRIFYLINNTYS